jgi:hypothetical protein
VSAIVAAYVEDPDVVAVALWDQGEPCVFAASLRMAKVPETPSIYPMETMLGEQWPCIPDVFCDETNAGVNTSGGLEVPKARVRTACYGCLW